MFSPIIKQTWAVSPILLAMLGQGMVLGSTSCLLPALLAEDSPIKIDLEISSWIVATVGIGNLFGYPMASVCMAIFGRKIAYGFILLPGIVGMMLIFSTSNIASLICGRLLAGMTSGGSSTLGAVIIGEYCSPQNRGMFLNLKTAGLYLGSLLVHVLGFKVHWRTVILLSTMPYVIAFFITCTIPESPSWLVQKKRYKESEEIFYRLRGSSEDSVREIEELIRVHSQVSESSERTLTDKIVDFARKFTKKNFLKPMQIFVFAAVLLETSGRHIFPAYATQIITMITGSESHLLYFTIASDTIITVSALFSSYLIKVIKLRKLLFTTGLISCALIALACSYLYLVAKDLIPKDYPMIPVSLFGLYLIFSNFGCSPVPLALIGELFPLEHRAIGGTIVGYMISFFLTIMLKIMPFMLHFLEIYGTFAVLSICTALSLLALYFTLPETKNRTLQDIEDFFNHGRVTAREMRLEKEARVQMICKEQEIQESDK